MEEKLIQTNCLKKQITTVFFFVGLISALSSCRDKNEVNCDCAERINANFVIEEPSGYSENGVELFFETDTVLIGDGSITRFRALQDDNDYSWIVGNSANTSELQSWGLNNFPENQSIEVELSVTGSPSLDCFPDDDGVDTQAKTFVAVDYANAPKFGTYRGSLSSAPLDSFEITIFRDNIFPETWGEATYIQNFPPGYFVNLEGNEFDDHYWYQQLGGGANCLSSREIHYCYESLEELQSDTSGISYKGYFYKKGQELFGKGTIRYIIEIPWQPISFKYQDFTYHGFKVH